MHPKFSSALAALCCTSQAFAQPAISPRVLDPEAAVDAVFTEWASIASPGCSVSVAQGEQVLLSRAYGMADLEHGVPNTTSTVFEIGSAAKQFTAAAALLLVEENKLALDDDIRKYLPEMPNYGHKITIDHLMKHQSGLREWSLITAFAGWPRTTRVYTNGDVLDLAKRQRKLSFEPGRHFNYSNTNYVLLTLIIERVTGKSLSQVTSERIFRPLGMNSAQWRTNFRVVVKNRAVGYQKAGPQYVQLMPFEDTYGSGGLLITAGDMMRWNEALSKDHFGPTFTRMLTAQAMTDDGRATSYARGMDLARFQGHREISGEGGTAGYRGWLGRYPDAGLSVALACNSASLDPTGLARKVASVFLADLPEEALPSPSPGVPLPPERLSARAGVFVHDEDTPPVVLVAEKDRLRAEGWGLETISDSRFNRKEWGEVVFTGPDTIEVTRTGEKPRRYRRIDARTTAAQLASLTGRYVSEEAAGAGHNVVVTEGKLVLLTDGRASSRFTLQPLAPDVFQLPGAPRIMVRFLRDRKGDTLAFIIHDLPHFELRFNRAAALSEGSE